MSLRHHELCFGCGRTNLFGLLVELEPAGADRFRGRWFVKQDHQGPIGGQAHPGLIACALVEAIMLAAGPVDGDLTLTPGGGAGAPVGAFCELTVQLGPPVQAVASADGEVLATVVAAASSRED